MLVLKYFQLGAGFDILPRPRRGNKHEFRNVSTRHRSFFFLENSVQHLSSCGHIPLKQGGKANPSKHPQKQGGAGCLGGPGEERGAGLVFKQRCWALLFMLVTQLFLREQQNRFSPSQNSVGPGCSGWNAGGCAELTPPRWMIQKHRLLRAWQSQEAVSVPCINTL